MWEQPSSLPGAPVASRAWVSREGSPGTSSQPSPVCSVLLCILSLHTFTVTLWVSQGGMRDGETEAQGNDIVCSSSWS